MRTFAGKLASLAALVGFVLVAAMAGAGYTLVSTIRAGNEALSTYADELILAWSLQEAHERKLAAGRGLLLWPGEVLGREFETATADAEIVLARLRERVTSRDGIALLDDVAQRLTAHDREIREVMAMKAPAGGVASAWYTRVRPKATDARDAMNAFIRYKQNRQDRARAQVVTAQQRAAWLMASTSLAALILAVLGGGRLLRSAQRTYSAEMRARTAADEERLFFYTLLDQLPIGVIAADPSGRIIHTTSFARTILDREGLLATKAGGGVDQWPLFRPDGTRYSAHDLPLARAVRGEAVVDEEVRSMSDRFYSVTAGPIRDDDGRNIAAVVAFVDISDRKRSEKERELFIGVLGHDLRNPLHSIALAANSLALREDVPDVAKTPAVRIASSADRMNALISELLDFARSQHRAIPIKPESCQLRDIAADVIAEIKLAQPNREIRVEPEGGCNGHWDRARLAQVFQNLLANAVDHGDSSAPITVRTGCDEHHVWARVTSLGTIPQEERLRMFEPFRARATSKGLGLGLYIARAIIEAHGGTIAVDCDGDRTTFLIRLPLRAKPHPYEAAIPATARQ